MPPPIPDRWTDYKPCGKVIDGTKIICFKVPLRKHFQVGNDLIKTIWDINALIQTVPNLGAVIDLTNTKRYYNAKDIEKTGVLYKKILMPGRIIPPENKVVQFMDVVDEYANQGLLVGVHCTHGLNRTGYMVCRYMRDRLNMPAAEAIKKFEKARGYRIERENFISDLLGQPAGPEQTAATASKEQNREREVRDNRMKHGHSDLEGYGQSKFERAHNIIDNGYEQHSRRHYNSSNRDRSRNQYDDKPNWTRKSDVRKNCTDTAHSYDYRYDY